MASYPTLHYGDYHGRSPDQRATHQINEVLKEFPGARSINSQRTLLEVPIQFRDGRVVELQINLPVGFPDVPPVLVLSQAIVHQHVDSNRVIQVPSLIQWNAGMKLVKVVQDAQAILTGHSTGNQNIPTGQSVPGTTGTVGEIVKHLEDYSNEDLGTCIVNAEAYKKLAGRVASTLQASRINDDLRKSNEKAAIANLDFEKEIGELVNQVAIIKSSEYGDARKNYEEQARRHMAVAGKISIPALINSLQEAARQVDEESEELDEKFRNGEVELEDFAKEYCKMRIEFYTRELKAQAATQLDL